VIVVAGTNKIVPNLEEAYRRQEQYCFPLTSAQVRVVYKAYGIPGTQLNNAGNKDLLCHDID
jgi:hypothetical protein